LAKLRISLNCPNFVFLTQAIFPTNSFFIAI
jgi:hypothetical protein